MATASADAKGPLKKRQRINNPRKLDKYADMTPANPLRRSLDHNGYVIVPALLPPSSIPPLLSAARTNTALARSGGWPHIRSVPKQFPPWPTTPPASGIWGVQHLLHPFLPSSPTFTSLYFSPPLLAICKELLQCTDADLVMELCNLLVGVEAAAGFALRWHRDDIPTSATPAEEEARLRDGPAWHAQWNVALVDDESLVVVPGSHRRARTRAEREAGPEDVLEGEVRVGLKAGDAVFYDNNVLHRGVYEGGKERFTVHGSVGHKGGGGTRARNVLQHGVGEWVGNVDLGVLGEGEERDRAEGMRGRLVEMGRGKRDVGFSLEG
ncbi:MAG: hypothetical protein M1833_000107 [Piccolia ochrophora]|nr:MAG: hypothetical protein M1833_000107 [Piccolia ochrophora]